MSRLKTYLQQVNLLYSEIHELRHKKEREGYSNMEKKEMNEEIAQLGIAIRQLSTKIAKLGKGSITKVILEKPLPMPRGIVLSKKHCVLLKMDSEEDIEIYCNLLFKPCKIISLEKISLGETKLGNTI